MVSLSLSHFFFFKQKTAYEMRISDWSSDVCSSDLLAGYAELHRIADRRTVLQPGHAQLQLGEMRGDVVDQPVAQFLARVDVVGADNELGEVGRRQQLGRASCRERVCQYV